MGAERLTGVTVAPMEPEEDIPTSARKLLFLSSIETKNLVIGPDDKVE